MPLLPIQRKITVRRLGDAVVQPEVHVNPAAQALPPGLELTP